MGIFIRVILIVCVFIYLSSFFYIITSYDEYFVDEEVKEENKSVDSTTFKMVLTFSTAFRTPFAKYLCISPSRNSRASRLPVDAPDATMLLP